MHRLAQQIFGSISSRWLLSGVVVLATIRFVTEFSVRVVPIKRGDSRADTRITRSKIYRPITTSKEPIHIS